LIIIRSPFWRAIVEVESVVSSLWSMEPCSY
jgi:hypothetical protein